MQLTGISIALLAILGTASAQIAEDSLRSRIAAVHYAPLAEAARIQGNVHVSVELGVATLLSGNPLLARTALESAQVLGSVQSGANLDLTYHFVIVDTATSVPAATTINRGNMFERTILRALGRDTKKVVVNYICQEGVPPPNALKIEGSGIEIWIYGRTRCVMT